ncbi:uncharacterized protein LOC120354308 [Nilaparvata lugens]|uniref:uncharacterized protein LOC120354308 n=1 Tax=Nilaparvata lugens TaxID=108931 RepID=UPI00193D6D14|nr:uncharacterized protein LOC120354308 [Nilaparvata lugens]
MTENVQISCRGNTPKIGGFSLLNFRRREKAQIIKMQNYCDLVILHPRAVVKLDVVDCYVSIHCLDCKELLRIMEGDKLYGALKYRFLLNEIVRSDRARMG